MNHYRRYIQSSNDTLRNTKLLKDISNKTIKLPDASGESPLDILFSADQNLITILYPSFLLFLDREALTNGVIGFYLKLTLVNNIEFKRVHIQTLGDSNYMLISTFVRRKYYI